MMTVMTPRESWTDERLGDLSQRVDQEFGLVRTELRDMRADTSARFDGVEKRFERLEDRFAALNRTLIAGAIALCASVLVAGIF